MTQEEQIAECLQIQQDTEKKKFEQDSRIKAIDVANSYGRTSDNPLNPRGKSVESLLADAEKIYKWLINQ